MRNVSIKLRWIIKDRAKFKARGHFDHFYAPCYIPPKTLARIRTGGGATKLLPVMKAEPRATHCHLRTPIMYTAYLDQRASSYEKDLLRVGRLYVSVYIHKLTNLCNHLDVICNTLHFLQCTQYQEFNKEIVNKWMPYQFLKSLLLHNKWVKDNLYLSVVPTRQVVFK